MRAVATGDLRPPGVDAVGHRAGRGTAPFDPGRRARGPTRRPAGDPHHRCPRRSSPSDAAAPRSTGAMACSAPTSEPSSARLGVFAGGFGLEAAESVTEAGAATVDALDGLVLKSMVELRAEQGRYQMLEPIRQYAVELLIVADEDDRVRGAHASMGGAPGPRRESGSVPGPATMEHDPARRAGQPRRCDRLVTRPRRARARRLAGRQPRLVLVHRGPQRRVRLDAPGPRAPRRSSSLATAAWCCWRLASPGAMC